MTDSEEKYLRELILRLWPKLIAAARVAVRDSDTVNDLVQETVLKILADTSKLNDVKRMEAYIFKVLYNTIADRNRNMVPQVPLSDLNEKDWACDYDDDTYDVYDTKTNAAKESLKLLKPNEQSIVQMYDSLEMSAAEIANIMKVSESTVRYILKESHRKMKKYIEDELKKKGYYI